jgi:protein-tyrosine phosphatase
MSVLVVCTANVCRSPLAARLLSASLDVPVLSAGAHAVPGLPACPASVAFPPSSVRDHASLPLGPGHVRSASLVLGAAREHRSAAIALVPNAQRKAFTLLQAARLAAWLADQGVKAPPELAGEERLAWWVDELDAVRGDAPRGDAGDDDLPDPHEGVARHEVVLPRLASAAETLAAVLA